MGLLEIAKFKFYRLGYLSKLIEEWKPVDCKTEKQYEKSLYAFLKNISLLQ
jgi:hypothetical protein